MTPSVVKTDATLAAAVEVALEAARSIAEAGAVGAHLGMQMDDERLATHYFECLAPGYPGWRWAVTVARVPRGKAASVCETGLVPGDGALLSPAWLPYSERLAPGDVGAGDVTPYVADDPLLEAGFEATGEEDVDQVALFELGLGRARVLSGEGREAAAQRWYDGESGPSAAVAAKAGAPCSSCGYYVPMAGVLRQVFGVCANAWSPSDGRVVSLDHGCGAHSEVDVDRPEPEQMAPPILDDFELEVSEPEPAEPAEPAPADLFEPVEPVEVEAEPVEAEAEPVVPAKPEAADGAEPAVAAVDDEAVGDEVTGDAAVVTEPAAETEPAEQPQA